MTAGELEHGPACTCTRCRGFQPGHSLATRHGAYAVLALSRDERVSELAAAIAATQAVAHPADEGAIWRLALCYRRLELSAAALDEADQGLAKPLSAYTDKAAWLGRLRSDHREWLRAAGRIEEELARTPASRAKLGLHLALAERTLGDLAATGAEIRARRKDGGDG